jgi:hypothetical protein
MEHCYSYTNRADEMCAQTKDMGVQTTMTYADIEDLEKRVKSLDDADKMSRDLFVAKVTKDDKSIQKYTGLPSKQILGGVFGMMLHRRTKCRNFNPEFNYKFDKNGQDKGMFQHTAN